MQSLRLRKTSCYTSSLHHSLRTFAPLYPSPDAPKPHSADSYLKDVDETAPQDPTIHRVDATSDAVQRPYEPPSGQWSQAGVRTSEYYASEHESKVRYSDTEKLGPETSDPGEGPGGQLRGGRGKSKRSPGT
ncbi:hypothetical protein BDR04DRAFT_1094900 [Suillus decipiens]|nr:hypothetical protein BDR04DRAFT_1094900 [Suillus decipiens]